MLFTSLTYLPRDATKSAVLLRQSSAVRGVEVSWSHRLGFFENYLLLVSLGSSLSANHNIRDLLQGEHPEILTGMGISKKRLSAYKSGDLSGCGNVSGYARSTSTSMEIPSISVSIPILISTSGFRYYFYFRFAPDSVVSSRTMSTLRSPWYHFSVAVITTSGIRRPSWNFWGRKCLAKSTYTPVKTLPPPQT